MDFKLICSRVTDLNLPQNAGYDQHSVEVALMEQGHSSQVVDGLTLPDSQRDKLSDEARFLFIRRGRAGERIKGVFGSNNSRYDWQDFGKGTPALFGYEGERLVEVFPHKTNEGFRTIANFLGLD